MGRGAASRVMQEVMRTTEKEAYIGRFTKGMCRLLILRLARRCPDLPIG